MCNEGTVPVCINGMCVCSDEVPWGRIGQYSSMAAASESDIWVSAYNSYHGDLMVAEASGPGRIPNESWQFIDGVPDGPVVVPNGTVRGGIQDPGDDVGLYTDIAVAADGTVQVSYFDQTSGSLKLATNPGGSGTWTTQVVDAGQMGDADGASFDVAGQYSSITLGADGTPAIGYFAHVADADGERTELRFAQSSSASPAAEGDWTVSVLDSAPVADESSDPLPVPIGVGLFVTSARLSDGSPVVAYYDRVNGELKVDRFDPGAGAFAAPEVLDGGGGVDVGWYPALAVDANDQLHISYESATNDDLMYIDTIDNTPELVDDGYRIVGTTDDGLPKPEFHFVGDDSNVVLTADGPYLAYQDATSHEVLLAHQDGQGAWQHDVVAGDEDPFVGGYGFYLRAQAVDDQLMMSTWVVDQPDTDAWVEILGQPLATPPTD